MARRSFWRRILAEPVLLAAAIRSSLLAISGFSLGMDGSSVAILMVSVEAWIALVSRVVVGTQAKEREAKGRTSALAAVKALGRNTK